MTHSKRRFVTEHTDDFIWTMAQSFRASCRKMERLKRYIVAFSVLFAIEMVLVLNAKIEPLSLVIPSILIISTIVLSMLWLRHKSAASVAAAAIAERVAKTYGYPDACAISPELDRIVNQSDRR